LGRFVATIESVTPKSTIAATIVASDRRAAQRERRAWRARRAHDAPHAEAIAERARRHRAEQRAHRDARPDRAPVAQLEREIVEIGATSTTT
jgi:hypothetical protein